MSLTENVISTEYLALNFIVLIPFSQFEGNNNSINGRMNDLFIEKAKFVRLHPLKNNNKFCLQMALYGCQPRKFTLRWKIVLNDIDTHINTHTHTHTHTRTHNTHAHTRTHTHTHTHTHYQPRDLGQRFSVSVMYMK